MLLRTRTTSVSNTFLRLCNTESNVVKVCDRGFYIVLEETRYFILFGVWFYLQKEMTTENKFDTADFSFLQRTWFYWRPINPTWR